MRTWLRRLRGALGMGLTWGMAWAMVGFVPRWVLGFNPDAPFPIIFGVFGVASGLAFSVILALVAGRHRLDQLSVGRLAAWGAAAGLLIAGGFAQIVGLGVGDALGVAAAFATASALSASGSLALARRALLPRTDGLDTPRLPGAG